MPKHNEEAVRICQDLCSMRFRIQFCIVQTLHDSAWHAKLSAQVGGRFECNVPKTLQAGRLDGMQIEPDPELCRDNLEMSYRRKEDS